MPHVATGLRTVGYSITVVILSHDTGVKTGQVTADYRLCGVSSITLASRSLPAPKVAEQLEGSVDWV